MGHGLLERRKRLGTMGKFWKDNCIYRKAKKTLHGRLLIPIVGWFRDFSYFGFGALVLVNGNMNSEVYVNILDNRMLSTL